MFKKLLVLMLLVMVIAPVAQAQDQIETRALRAELRFLQGMIDHHQMALDMAGDCLNKAVSERVVGLCAMIIDLQSEEIELMRAWLLDWHNVAYSPISMLAEHESEAAHHGHHGQAAPASDPAMMMGMMAGLNRLAGVPYEIAWLEAMIDHHDDAVHMANRILRHAVREEVRALAIQIIADQTQEIVYMEELIDALIQEAS